jgi:hypothetical protein
VLVDREPDHVFAPSLLWLMVGQRTADAITRPLARLARKGIEVRIGTIACCRDEGMLVAMGGPFDTYSRRMSGGFRSGCEPMRREVAGGSDHRR